MVCKALLSELSKIQITVTIITDYSMGKQRASYFSHDVDRLQSCNKLEAKIKPDESKTNGNYFILASTTTTNTLIKSGKYSYIRRV